MATYVKSLKQGEDTILPRTRSFAVIMDDGTTLEYSINNVSTNQSKLSSEVANALGLVAGSTLSSALIALHSNTNTSNVIAAAEVI